VSPGLLAPSLPPRRAPGDFPPPPGRARPRGPLPRALSAPFHCPPARAGARAAPRCATLRCATLRVAAPCLCAPAPGARPSVPPPPSVHALAPFLCPLPRPSVRTAPHNPLGHPSPPGQQAAPGFFIDAPAPEYIPAPGPFLTLLRHCPGPPHPPQICRSGPPPPRPESCCLPLLFAAAACTATARVPLARPPRCKRASSIPAVRWGQPATRPETPLRRVGPGWVPEAAPGGRRCGRPRLNSCAAFGDAAGVPVA
jgi:hypothetical protein